MGWSDHRPAHLAEQDDKEDDRGRTAARHRRGAQHAHPKWRCSVTLEERVREPRLAGEVVGSAHLALGQEAIAVGACAALSPTDTLAVTCPPPRAQLGR